MNAPTSIEQLAPEARHIPFSWLHGELQGNGDAEFAAKVKTLCTGLATCASIIHSDGMLIGNGEVPALNEFDSDAMKLFVVTTAQMVADMAEQRIDYLTDRAIQLAAK